MKKIIFSILIGLIAFPTIAFGGTFVSSLIQGKTVEEAVQILASQVDSLIGRVVVLEEKTANVEAKTNIIEDKTAEIEDKTDIIEAQAEENKNIAEGLRVQAEELKNQAEEAEIKANEMKINADKEIACRKAGELMVAPPETKIMYYSESNNPVNSKFAPDTTLELLGYLQMYMKNYEKTGSIYYQHNPDYQPETAQKYIPVLESRQEEYLIQQALCNK
jgi:chromosome segregation ATPase